MVRSGRSPSNFYATDFFPYNDKYYSLSNKLSFNVNPTVLFTFFYRINVT